MSFELDAGIGLQLNNKGIKIKYKDSFNVSRDTFSVTGEVESVDATVLESFDSPSTNPSGLSFDGTNLISCDFEPDLIYIHDGVTSTILDSFASPSTLPYGLTFDGTNLISCDGGSDLIYIYGLDWS